MIDRFERATPELCMAFNQILDIVENHFVASLEPGLTYFKSFATFCSYYLQIILFTALENVWDFIDGTVRTYSHKIISEAFVK